MDDFILIQDSPPATFPDMPQHFANLAVSDSSDSHERDESTDGEEKSEDKDDNEDNREELKATSHALGLAKGYVVDWTLQDAFRELYQNWKDAIIEKFGLDQRSFKPQIKELVNEIQILVHHPTVLDPHTNQNELLGYILYKKKPGSVELTNFKAQLARHNLELGGTTKRQNHNENVAGTHGEGLKIAALVLRRNEHRVRITASGFYWNFGFNGPQRRNLYCRLTPVQRKDGDKRRYRGRAGSRNLVADPWNDVSLLIGKAYGINGQKVSEDNFRRWMKVALDIEGPKHLSDIIETQHGDLILDEAFKGKLYLKGLLLPSGGSTIKQLEFGYNLLRGRTNRDRERPKDEREQVEVLTGIWEEAIELRAADTVILDKYIWLLQDNYECADINLAEKLISRKTASAIWDQLLKNRADKFYYCQTDTGADSDIIRRHLKLQPFPLSEKLWKILRRFSLARTPHEQRIFLFKNSSPSELQATIFSNHVRRGLVASLALHPWTQQVSMEFVHGAGTDIDLLFDKAEQMLKVHEKWLDFTKIHETAPCQISQLPDARIFTCDHVVKELHELVMHEIMESSDLVQSDVLAFVRSMRQKIREKIRQMPRMVSITDTDQPHELVVSWTDSESELIRELLGDSVMYCVILHQERTCSQRKAVYLFQEDGRGNSMGNDPVTEGVAQCECHQIMVSQTSRRAVFTGLDPRELYFPMVARAEDGSFFGIPPEAMQPKSAPRRPNREIVRSIPFEGSAQDIMYSDDDEDGPHAINIEGATHEINGISDFRSTPVPPRGDVSPATHGRGQQLAVRTRTESDNTQRTKWHQEQYQKWSVWEAESLQSIIDQFFSPRILPVDAEIPPDRFSISSLACPHLGVHEFIVNEYVQVHLPSDIDAEDVVESVLLIHDILHTQREGEAIQFFLLATRYTLLQSLPLFSSAQQLAGPINGRELLLHFTEFKDMGKLQDAEIIPVNEIIQARNLENPVQHVAHAPEDLEANNFYCRFAIRGRFGDESACLTPIGSNLLGHGDRWKLPRYSRSSKPVVIDLSPSILGLAEGFEGYEICAGVGFNPGNDMTWKTRYPSAIVYDDHPTTVLSQLASGQLTYPDSLGPGIPKVLVVGGWISHFELTSRDGQARFMDEFLRAMETIQVVLDNSSPAPESFDFLVCIMPSAILHPKVTSTFTKTIFSLLQKRYSVHIQNIYLPNYGLLPSQNYTIILASPICASPTWTWSESVIQKTMEDIIGDLAFQNPRISTRNPGAGSLMCMKPSNTNETVYNHNTSARIPLGTPPVAMDTTMMKMQPFLLPFFQHPTRHDLLTVRELARIYGFSDDFVFYNKDSASYLQLSRSVPPPIARIVAKGIRKIIEGCTVMEFGVSSMMGDPRGSKRPRTSL